MPVGSEKRQILVVDDEPVIADTLVAIFNAAGHSARAAYSAEQALDLLAQSGWAPDFALLDVLLPKMSGVDLAIRMRNEYPVCDVTLFSGYSATTALLQKAKSAGHHFKILAKPVHPSHFLDLISRTPAPS